MHELGLGLFALAVAALVWALQRTPQASPVALWVWGWVILFVSVLFDLDETALAWAPRITHFGGPMLPALAVAGACAYTDRSWPRWLLPGALAFGALRWGLGFTAFADLGHAAALLLEPGAAIAAAAILYPATRGSNQTAAQRALVPTFGALAALEAATAAWDLSGAALPSALTNCWPALATVSLGVLLTAGGHRARARRRAHEREEARFHQALAASEQRFRMLADHARDLFFECDEEGHFLFASRSFREILGFDPATLVGRDCFASIHPEDRPAGAAAFRRAVETEGPSEGQFRYRHASGEWRWLETRARGFRDGSGALRVVLVARDVTERRHQEVEDREAKDALEQSVAERTAELHATQERYRTVSELSSDLSFALLVGEDGGLEIDWITQAMTRVTGYTLAEIRERGIAIAHPEDRVHSLEQFLAARDGESREWELRMLTRTDDVRWLRVRVARVRSESDGRLRVIGAARDITERVQAEAERRRLESHLAEVQRLDSLGVLAGGIAHDFNNLLNVILGNSSLIAADLPPDSALRRQVGQIQSAARHAAALTAQMLAYSGRADVVLKPLHLPAAVAGSLDLLEAAIGKHCRLETHLAGRLPLIEGDETQLRQVVLNLVANASEALEGSGGRIELRTGVLHADRAFLADTFGAADLPEGEYVTLEVRDDGPGIDAEARARIFEPFYTTRFSGRGLGLAAVLGIVRGHGGAIKLESGPGRGTRFRILLPPAPADAARASDPQRGPSSRGRTVLVVDDDEAVRELTAELLRRAGFEPIPSGGGREALALLRERAPEIDAVLLDIAMPGLDGEATFREIRRIREDLPVVLASGYDEERTGARFAGRQIAGFVRKPFEPEELVATLRASMGG